MITTLSADDVRRQVMSVWCSECQAPAPCGTIYEDHKARGILRDPLFTRCPGCQPESLYWGEPGEDDHGGRYKGSWILRQRETKVWIAIDLILMSIARDATAAYTNFRGKPIETAYDNITTAVMSTEFEDAVKWRHRLKDLEDKT